MSHDPFDPPASRRRQRGITTLAITLIMLVVITAMVLFSTSVGYFEQRTTTNQNRATIVQRASEYALSLAGEYLKANRTKLISDDAAENGWLASTTKRWAKCADVGTADAAALDAEFPAGHPCLSERDVSRRAQLYFWSADGTTAGSHALPYRDSIPDTVEVEAGVGGNADFSATTVVGALLCRFDTTDLTNVDCKLEPNSGNRVALTLVAQSTLTGEGADAQVKEAWATYNSFVPSAAVPLVASGLVKGLGNAQIVAAPNAGGYGLPGSVWTPQNADVDSGGSVTTCHIGDFLKGTPEDELKTTCATTDDCTCNGGSTSEFLSGHIGGTKREMEDIIDVDGGPAAGNGVLPDIVYFPGKNAVGTEMDDPGDPTDDSLFEYTFNLDYVAAEVDDEGAETGIKAGETHNNCLNEGADPDTNDMNCVTYAMTEAFDATPVDDCGDLNTDSSGIIYIAGGCTEIPNSVGSADSPAIVVLNQPAGTELSLNSDVVFYGLLFVHSDTNSASVKGNGSIKIFGALVVEGDVEISGNITLVYDDTSASGDTHKLPSSARFGRVAGSWLDASTAF